MKSEKKSSTCCEISGIDRIQILMQLHDRMLVSAKTILKEVGLDSEKEAAQYKIELDAATKNKNRNDE